MEIDLSNLPLRTRQKMDEIFRSDFDLRVLKAIERQTATAAQRRDRLQWRDDLRPTYEIDPFVDSLWRQYYGHDYTENADLMKFLANRNPEIVTRSKSPKIMVGYAGEKKGKGKGAGERGRLARGVRFDAGTMEFAR